MESLQPCISWDKFSTNDDEWEMGGRSLILAPSGGENIVYIYGSRSEIAPGLCCVIRAAPYEKQPAMVAGF